MTAVLLTLLKRPLLEIAAIFGMTLLSVVAVGFSLYLIAKGLAKILTALHIKKIGVTGIECETKRK